MRVGILGLGFVGSAIEYFFKQHQIDYLGYDKFKNGGIGQLEDLISCDFIFMGLPTPYSDQLQTYDLSALEENLKLLQEFKYSGTILVKSTLVPTSCEKFAQDYQLSIIHNPEFLTARSAKEDFLNQTQIILGTTSFTNQDHLQEIKQFYEHYFPKSVLKVTTATQSETVKLFVNSFYAQKVQIFNEYYLLAQKLEIDFTELVEMMLANKWIHPMHTQVPGPDGQLSYGGYCFPKDTQALASFMKDQQVPAAVLSATIQERNEMRSD